LADLCLAVSQTSDPTGPYDQYAFEVNNQGNGLAAYFNDYPKISAWPKGVAEIDDQQGGEHRSGGSYFATANPNRIFCGLGNTISAFDREAMLAGDLAPAFVTFFVPGPVPGSTMPDCNPAPSVPRTHMLPADLDGRKLPPDDAPGYIVQVQDEHLGFPAGRLQVYEFDVDWTKPSSATLTPTTSLTPQPFNSNACPGQACIHQPGMLRLDQVAQGTIMYRLSYRNFGDHQILLFNHTVAADGNPNNEHAGIRWYELRRTTSVPWFIYQQGTGKPQQAGVGGYAPDSNDRWLGSIAMDRHGNIALGFDVSGITRFPSIHYVTRRPGDPLGELPRGEVSIIEGRGAQLGPLIFFGDYSQMTVDPRDDCTFWYTNTYYPKTTISDLWHTRIAAFRFPDCRKSEEGEEDEREEREK
jgi:hypothetical protein